MIAAEPILPGHALRRPRPSVAEDDALRRRAERRLQRRLEQDIRAALVQEHLVLHYQPHVELATGMSRGAEALLRWPHRSRGPMPPAFFLPVTEQSELSVEIGAWVLRTACREAAGWEDQSLGVSVNVAGRQLQGGALLGQLAAALEESGLAPERLELELDETTLLELDTDPLLALCAVRDLGVGITLDDFGTGHASLAMLKRLPLTTVKLDRSLVRGLPAEPEDAAITGAILQTARVLGLATVAEGIETEEQRDFLCQDGCEQGQGFFFSPAIPAATFRAQLATDSGLVMRARHEHAEINED
jgi:EAL domain-containing protein (putative c-di-GMP-specific phosphodiesterase class I)